MLDTPNGTPVTWIIGNQSGVVRVPCDYNKLIIEHLQQFLDQWIADHDGEGDYIHGADTARMLAQKPNTVGFIVPDFDKSILFPYILSGRVMPRKTFSIGQAVEKRYYLEGRKIK